jgi:DNA repair protein RecO (recombination protein O)
LELFTPEHGRFAAVAKGVRKARSATQGLLEPFYPLSVSWVGKGELMTLTHVEAQGSAAQLRGECLFAGFYLNELLITLLQKWDAHPRLFALYERTLAGLQADSLAEGVLRSFEKALLEELGYGLLPKTAAALQNSFLEEQYYRFTPDQGFILQEAGVSLGVSLNQAFSGKSLLAIAQENWQDIEALKDAKRLMRLVLAPLLGARQIHSRKLFIKFEESE